MDTTDLLTQLPEFHPLFEGLESFELFFFAEKSHLISPNGCKYFNTSKENYFFFSVWHLYRIINEQNYF